MHFIYGISILLILLNLQAGCKERVKSSLTGKSEESQDQSNICDYNYAKYVTILWKQRPELNYKWHLGNHLITPRFESTYDPFPDFIQFTQIRKKVNSLPKAPNANIGMNEKWIELKPDEFNPQNPPAFTPTQEKFHISVGQNDLEKTWETICKLFIEDGNTDKILTFKFINHPYMQLQLKNNENNRTVYESIERLMVGAQFSLYPKSRQPIKNQSIQAIHSQQDSSQNSTTLAMSEGKTLLPIPGKLSSLEIQSIANQLSKIDSALIEQGITPGIIPKSDVQFHQYTYISGRIERDQAGRYIPGYLSQKETVEQLQLIIKDESNDPIFDPKRSSLFEHLLSKN